jgi:Holliday junction resolvase RusA-like endonuclease
LQPETILDLPPPPSVNRTRKVDWRGRKLADAWIKQADGLVLRFGQMRTAKAIPGQFEAHVILSDRHTGIDCDNALKQVCDYARRLELITDDGPKYMRRVVVEYGEAPHGCRLILKAWEAR